MSEDLLKQFQTLFSNHSVLEVDFIKKNGERRLMTCTLDPELMPIVLFESLSVKKRMAALEAMSVWDLTAKDWRAFKITNVNMISTQRMSLTHPGAAEHLVLYIKDRA